MDLCGTNRVDLERQGGNKMGRPILPSKFGSGAGKLEVTGAFSNNTTQPDGSGAEAVSTATGNYIVAQRGSNRFKVNFLSADGSTRNEEVLTLKAVAPNSLTNGEFCVQVILDDSTVAYVSRFYNNTVHCSTVTNPVAHHSVMYSLGAEGNDEGGGSGEGEKEDKNTGSIDVI